MDDPEGGIVHGESDDRDYWRPLGGSAKAGYAALDCESLRSSVRRLVTLNPYGRQALRLLEDYVIGPEVTVTHRSSGRADDRFDAGTAAAADEIWTGFLRRASGHLSPREFGRRLWRDGECFVRLFAEFDGELTARFVDPELIGSDGSGDGIDGIVSEPDDIETVLAYELLDAGRAVVSERVPADEMVHARYGVDANERRGVSLFAAMLEPLEAYEKWLETELAARRLQSSIVLWRKVQGSPSRVVAAAEGGAGGSGAEGVGREKIAPGTIVTTSAGKELQFLQPQTNFGDALPLGRSLLLAAAAAAGLPEFMLTADASNGNFASTMVAEGPAVKFFESEQRRLAAELDVLRVRILNDAERRGLLPAGATGLLRAEWTFPQLVGRDRSRDRDTDARLVEVGVLSRAEVARRDGVDAALMRDEIDAEAGDSSL
ncbi:MAG: phage portal protein [Planctomycetota bacterium]